MAKVVYDAEGLYKVEIDTVSGNVKLGDQEYIINNTRDTSVFKRAYLLGREHKKSQIAKALGLLKN
jgi:hypothetical protein